MNPDVNKIFNKLKKDKVELSTEKVELSKINELIDIQKEVESYVGSAIKQAQDVESLFRRVRDRNEAYSKNADKLRQEAFQLMKTISDAYKSLGEKVPAKIDGIYDKIASDARRIPTSNIANIFPL